ncbi:MFS transporter [Agromyces intestinalis]|uniref:MFS transporter n=1 Tax=Agromyces intestinalis TaxID=2592652 RepID=A0A5C1YET8_9MICO|nr:MFS transporter [Agromyces intestinalis]QEO14631.1 MFS transporter [Agromyces intestinalis]
MNIVTRFLSLWRVEVHAGQARRFWAMVGVNLLVTAVSYGTAPFIPLVLDADGATGAEIGIVIACLAIGQLLGQVPAVWLATRVRLHWVVAFTLAVEAIAALGFALSHSFLLFCATRLVAGFGKALVSQSSRVCVTQCVPSGARGKAFGVLGGAGIMGIMIGPAAAGVIVALSDARTIFLLCAVVSAVAIGIAVPITRTTLRGVALVEDEPESDGPDASAHDGTRRRPSLLLTGILIEVFAAALLIGMFHSAWSLFLSERGAGPEVIGLAWSIFALPYLFLAPLAGSLSDRVNRKTMALLGTFVSASTALIYPELTWLPLLLMGEVIEAIAGALSEPALDAMASDASEREGAAKVFGLIGVGESTGQLVGMIGGGLLLAFGTEVPLRAGGLVAMGCCAIAAVLFFQPWRRRAKPSTTRVSSSDSVPSSVSATKSAAAVGDQ